MSAITLSSTLAATAASISGPSSRGTTVSGARGGAATRGRKAAAAGAPTAAAARGSGQGKKA
eukprot:6683291-Pyramimonas_sp.AAC.1